jgi:hypothetical protein
MRRSWYELYTLLVCFGSLIGLVVALFWLLLGGLMWADPELIVGSREHAEYQTEEWFWESYHRRDGRPQDDSVKVSEQEISRRQLARYEASLARMRGLGKLCTILSVFGTILASVFFMIHWRLARQAREMVRASEPSQGG